MTRRRLSRRVIPGKPDDSSLMSYLYPQATRIEAPEPPGGFRPPREPKAVRSRRRRRAAEAERLHLGGVFGIGAVVIAAAAVLVAVMVVVLVVQEH
jgi:hypothetical protein